MTGTSPQPESPRDPEEGQEHTPSAPGDTAAAPAGSPADSILSENPTQCSFFNPYSELTIPPDLLYAKIEKDPVLRDLVGRGFLPTDRQWTVQERFTGDCLRLTRDADFTSPVPRELLSQATQNLFSPAPWTIALLYKDSLPVQPDSDQAEQERLFSEWIVRSFPYGQHPRTGKLLISALEQRPLWLMGPDSAVVRFVGAQLLTMTTDADQEVAGSMRRFIVERTGLSAVTVSALAKTARGTPPAEGLEAAADGFSEALRSKHMESTPPPGVGWRETWRKVAAAARRLVDFLND